MWDAGDHLWRQGDRSGGSGSAARGQGHGRGTPPPAAASGATTCEVVHLGLITWLFGRRLNLPPAVTRVDVHRDLPVPMPDGVALLADLYVPRRMPEAPTVLIRTPYGRRGLFALLSARVLAERGFQVVLQSVRGTGGSGGALDPFAQERADGLATIDWVRRQPWFHGKLLLFGMSYLGYTQWAVAAEAGERVTAMHVTMSTARIRDLFYPGETFALETALTWTALMSRMTGDPVRDGLAQLVPDRRLAPALRHLPLGEADVVATGRKVAHFRQWLEHDEPGDPYWKAERDHDGRLAEVTAPVAMVAGWHDIFLPSQLEDFQALAAAGRKPYLTIGPWGHGSLESAGAAVREAITWFTAHVKGERPAMPGGPVRLYVQQADEWRDYATWPPPGARPTTWHLHADGRLAVEPPESSEPTRYRYDPADPTPSLGGPALALGPTRRDNRSLEARPDVVTFTGAPLTAPIDVIGPVRAVLHLRTGGEHGDVFVRLCDVEPSGRSMNVCDGIRRIVPDRFPSGPDGVRRVTVELWPTAYRFAAGHRIRVLVSGGAHPRYARNPGTGEPLGTATRLVATTHEVFHDPDHPSALILPVMGPAG